jgi:outer membrane protein insertion porin family
VTKLRSSTQRARGELLLALLAIVVLAAARIAFAQAGNPIVAQIRIEGNQRVETDAIKIHISQQAGQPLDRAAVDQDIKAIYGMGFFSSVQVERQTINGRFVLVYKVKEEPQVTDIRWKGMKEFRPTDDKIVNAVKVHPGSILDPREVKETINGVTDLYHDKSYLDAKITSSEILEADNTAVVVFTVNEGPKVWIRSIVFHGNKAFSNRTLKSVMETGTYNPLLSWFTGWGALDEKKLNDDVNRLTAFYYDNGYLNVHVNQPQVSRAANSLTVTIDIDEGVPYKVGRIVVAGDLKFPKKDLAKLITLRTGERFEGTKLQHDEIQLSDFYSNRGYAFVTVDPRTQQVPNTHRINITFHVVPGHVVIVNRINISGNTKTSDKVIRREMQIQEQEPYSAEAIRESKQRLDRLGFFTSTRITTSPSAQPDKINLDVHVDEANTAALQVAGGFDSYQIFGNFTLGNSNLFGGGESLMLNAQIGYLFQNYSISYTEPWFMDMPLRVSTQLFDNKIFLLSFNQASAGFSVNTFYPLTELGFKKLGPFSLKDVTAGLGYQFESVGITGLPPLTTYQILEYKGYTQTSELMPSIRRFTVDNPIDPRSGSVLSFDGQIGGLGGGNYFLKGVLHGRYFYPFWKSPTLGTFVVSQGVTFGIGTNLNGGTGGELPLYERFFPGGVGGTPSDVRGYQLYSLGPLVTLYNQGGQPISVQNIGGSKELIFSNEITFPILSGLGLRGVIFSDAGQAYQIQKSLDFNQLQASYGIGLRWRSPFGPLSVDIARPINPRAADLSTVFEIGAGAPL